MDKLKVLIVDDSPLMRTTLKKAFRDIPSAEVVTAVGDGQAALSTLSVHTIDLVILDLEMPGMDGRTFLKQLATMANKPEVIIFSGASQSAAAQTLDLLSMGARDFVAKPKSDDGDKSDPAQRIKNLLMPKIEAIHYHKKYLAVPKPVATPMMKKGKPFPIKAVVIASSTGGPQALEQFFTNWPDKPTVPVLIVQHMPPIFTEQLAQRLTKIAGFPVLEAQNGMVVESGKVYLAPGGFHMEAHSTDKIHVTIQTHQGPLVHSVRPAADLLFNTAAAIYGNGLLSIVMTGMGEDGAQGAQKVCNLGGRSWIQNQNSCAVYGMPHAVEMLGIQEFVGTPTELREALVKELNMNFLKKIS